jgi:signal transduction histidine kinase
VPNIRVVPWPERLYTWAQAHIWLMDTLFAVAVIALLLPVSLITIASGVPLRYWVLLRASLIAVHAAVFIRRVFPVVSFALVSGALAFETIVPLDFYRYDSVFLPSIAVFPIALYSLSLYGPTWSRPVGLVIGTLGAVMITARTIRVFPAGTSKPPQGIAARGFVLGVLLVVVFASWGFARLRQVRMAYLDLLEERARRAEAQREERARVAVREERARIAREMHDIVAHSLAVMVTQAQGGEMIAAKSPDRAVAALGTIARTGRSALADMRHLLGVLRAESAIPPVAKNPQPTLADLPELVDRVRAAGLEVHRSDSGTPRRVGAAIELTVYRLVQEALTNSLRHAGSGVRADLCLIWGDRELLMTVRDDGRGAPPGMSVGDVRREPPGDGARREPSGGGVPADASGDGGHGLIGMRERVAMLGGTFTAGPRAGGGFEVRVGLPTSDQATEGVGAGGPR